MINRLAFWAVFGGAAARAGAFIPGSGTAILPSISSAGCRSHAASTATGRRGCRDSGTVMMASSVAPAPRTKAEKMSEHFRLKEGGMVEFGSGQRVEVTAVWVRENCVLSSRSRRLVRRTWRRAGSLRGCGCGCPTEAGNGVTV